VWLAGILLEALPACYWDTMKKRAAGLRREVQAALDELREIESQLERGETSAAHQRVKATLARLEWLVRDEEQTY